MALNKVELIGGLTRDIHMTYTKKGTAIVELSLAVNGARYDFEARGQVVTTVYVQVQCFGATAERVAETEIRQGDEVYVLGELDQREVEKRDGTTERKTRVTASVVIPTRIRQQAAVSDGVPF